MKETVFRSRMRGRPPKAPSHDGGPFPRSCNSRRSGVRADHRGPGDGRHNGAAACGHRHRSDRCRVGRGWRVCSQYFSSLTKTNTGRQSAEHVTRENPCGTRRASDKHLGDVPARDRAKALSSRTNIDSSSAVGSRAAPASRGSCECRTPCDRRRSAQPLTTSVHKRTAYQASAIQTSLDARGQRRRGSDP
jgi:hypothetical protein